MKKDRFQSGLRSVRYAACVAFMLLAFCFSAGRVYAEEDYQVTPVQMKGTITTDSSLNVRSGPGTEYESIDKVSNDVVLTITGQADNGWYQVEINGRTGYVSDRYVDAEEAAQEPEDGEEELEQVGEPEEGYRGLHQSPAVIKAVVIGLLIVVVIVMLFVTLKGLRKDDDDDDDADDDDIDDEDDYEEEEDEDDIEDDDYDGEEDDIEDDYEEEDYESGGEYADEDDYAGKKAEKKEYILREEDYRVEIDPSFFEDREPIEQPAMVTGYLERKKIEEEAAKARAKEATEGKQKELDEAMEKLSELQREIERLKNQK